LSLFGFQKPPTAMIENLLLPFSAVNWKTNRQFKLQLQLVDRDRNLWKWIHRIL